MQDAPVSRNQIQDPWEKNVPGLGLGRDPVRTPMPWSRERHGGFSTAEPWLPVDTGGIAACERQRGDPASMLSLYQSLLRLRRAEPALAVGSYRSLMQTDSILVYQREHSGRKFWVALNMSRTSQPLPSDLADGQVALSTKGMLTGHDGRLGPNEGLILIP
jgi:alpha-glucosidase